MHVMIAARIEHQSARLVAMSGPIGSGQIRHAVYHVGHRIEQAFRIASITKRPRGAEPDLHQAVIAAIDSARIEIAFAPDDEPDQRLRQAVGMLDDQKLDRRPLVGQRPLGRLPFERSISRNSCKNSGSP